MATAQKSASGPIPEYDRRVEQGRLRNDKHQRDLIEHLQDLHEMLRDYHPPKVVHPTIESLMPVKKSIFDSLFGGKAGPKPGTEISDDLPQGLYMYGDVGSGKTMLMDLFFETLPPNITAKNRIHFHNFMQDVHKRLHKMRLQYGTDFDAIPFVSADIAEQSSVLCFDEFQCTDVADAMILRRLIQSLMSHGVVIVTTSNRHPDELYINGVQRQSFIPCIELLKSHLKVINLDSTTDYRKIPRPPSGVYHHPLDKAASSHADKWFRFLGSPDEDPPHSVTLQVWGRDLHVPMASGKAARFTFHDLIGRATGAADYLELMRSFDAFIVTDVPGMTYRERDWARRFITFIDAVYESRAKLVLTTAVPLSQLFLSRDEVKNALTANSSAAQEEGKVISTSQKKLSHLKDKVDDPDDHSDLSDAMRNLMDDLGMNMQMLKQSNMFSGDEEAFAFARALSRLTEMGSKEWVERGLGLESRGGKKEMEDHRRMRSHWREDSM
ncbi:putative mitochondrial atpase [Phaeomoniella chlamydospora]|uniref:Putative mitochondrial atpase n=1 Tax=Phaeomoniella chlamydospora TaxID=158046 RepID=A0A0G2EH42_PHACM|nr:putative mitochondrial atpase [Phaeomoniella chlamydospora]